jgi:VanZ family protein
VIGYGVFVLYLSSLEIIIRQAPFVHYDKVFHFVEYGVFALLWYRALRVSWPARRAWGLGLIALLLILLFAAFDEISQSKTLTRLSDPYDFAADAIGASSVILFMIIIERR